MYLTEGIRRKIATALVEICAYLQYQTKTSRVANRNVESIWIFLLLLYFQSERSHDKFKRVSTYISENSVNLPSFTWVT